jgi:hypothetical protein
MELDADWRLRVRTAIGDLRDEDLDLGLIGIDPAQKPPPRWPDFFEWRPLFAVALGGERLGELGTAIRVRDERPVLSIDRLILQPRAQGLGVARGLQEHLDRRLPELGIERMTLDASGGGSYAWAKLGYGFDLVHHSGQARYQGVEGDKLLARVRAELLGGYVPHPWPVSPECGGGIAPASATDSVARLLHSLAARSQRNAEVVEDFRSQMDGRRQTLLRTAAAIARFGQGVVLDGLRPDSWLGREVMTRATWSGVRDLPS